MFGISWIYSDGKKTDAVITTNATVFFGDTESQRKVSDIVAQVRRNLIATGSEWTQIQRAANTTEGKQSTKRAPDLPPSAFLPQYFPTGIHAG
ncbi:MAG: hypothetical protein IT492_23560 [Gammaproteobacteria bacterium]|nr:hypothetical protein [Gammaproteobacteria bacterium]